MINLDKRLDQHCGLKKEKLNKFKKNLNLVKKLLKAMLEIKVSLIYQKIHLK